MFFAPIILLGVQKYKVLYKKLACKVGLPDQILEKIARSLSKGINKGKT
jgi:hypothetical protein